MNIVNRYILKNLLVNLGLSLGILIFVGALFLDFAHALLISLFIGFFS